MIHNNVPPLHKHCNTHFFKLIIQYHPQFLLLIQFRQHLQSDQSRNRKLKSKLMIACLPKRYHKSQQERFCYDSLFASQAQEELEKDQTFLVPEVNILHETAEPARVYSTFVQNRLANEPVQGPPSNIPTDQPLHQVSYNSTIVDRGDDVKRDKGEFGGIDTKKVDPFSSLFDDDLLKEISQDKDLMKTKTDSVEFSAGLSQQPKLSTRAPSNSATKVSDEDSFLNDAPISRLDLYFRIIVDHSIIIYLIRYTKQARYQPGQQSTTVGQSSAIPSGGYGIDNGNYGSGFGSGNSNFGSYTGAGVVGGTSSSVVNKPSLLSNVNNINSAPAINVGVGGNSGSRFGRLAQFGVMNSANSNNSNTTSSSNQSQNYSQPSTGIGYGRHKF